MADVRDWSLDQIGRRLSCTDLDGSDHVLAADDRVRVKWVLSQTDESSGPIVDIGASDGAISRLLWDRTGHAPWMIERHPTQTPAVSLTAKLMSAWAYFGDAHDGLRTLPDGFFKTALLCEVLEHHKRKDAEALLSLVRAKAQTLIVTVPNRLSASYEADRRSRWDWPDHQDHYDAERLRKVISSRGWCVVRVEPIVGTLEDSIWLGAVCS